MPKLLLDNEIRDTNTIVSNCGKDADGVTLRNACTMSCYILNSRHVATIILCTACSTISRMYIHNNIIIIIISM